MKLTQLTSAVALLSAGVLATPFSGASADSIVKNDGTPVGRELKYENLTLYVTKPAGNDKMDKAVLYITDVFGIQLPENKLLADSFARAGYATVAPDLFDGHPAPQDLNSPGFNATDFLARYNATVTDAKLVTTLKYIREVLGAKAVGATGYCYGGRYAFRFAAPGRGIDAAFAAHPSLLEDGEITAAVKPASIAAAENDDLFTTERRHTAEGLLQQANIPFQISLYSGTSHGFGVRANVSDPQQRFAKETAFFQAIRWFNYWI